MTAGDQRISGTSCAGRVAMLVLMAIAWFLAMLPASLAQSFGGADTTQSSAGGPIRLRQSANEDEDSASAPQDAPLRNAAPRETNQRDTNRPTAGSQPGQPRQIDPTRPWLQSKPPEFEAFARLPRYGMDMVSTLAPGASDFTPIVPPDYVVQSGDELLLTIWGTVDADLRLVVDRTGRISIPRIGPVMVAGTRLADLPQAVTRQVSQVFKNFDVSVSVGRLRGVRVYVTGFVQRPGAYVLSSLSTAMNAVMRAGGPASSGSFRVIELRRGGQVVARLDLYDLLIRGDRGADQVLQPDDVIHVAAVGPEIAVRGSVNRQAIYEIKPGETVFDALRMAGGFNTVADRNRVALERLDERNAQRVTEMKLPAAQATPLSGGDILVAFSAVEVSVSVVRQNKRVKVEGEVLRPGDYLLPADSTVTDALRAAGGLTTMAYLFGTEFTRESVRKSQQDNYDRALRDFETQIARAGGTQRISSAEDAAALAASTQANTRLLEQLRALKPNGRIVLQLAPEAANLPDLTLEDGDRLTIPTRPNTIGVFGSVFSGGSYLYAASRTVGDYLQLAGGPTRGADQSSIFVVRANGTVNSSPQSSGWFARGVQIGGLPAEPGDTIFVPEELNKSTWVQSTKDWTQVLYQFGLGLAGIKSALGW